jgi:hypothetical protein
MPGAQLSWPILQNLLEDGPQKAISQGIRAGDSVAQCSLEPQPLALVQRLNSRSDEVA